MTRKGISIPEDEPSKFEREIGYELPSDYLTFILEYNGGEPDPYHFDVPTWQFKNSLIQELKGIDPDYIEPDLRQTHQTMGDILPKGFIIIGSDPGGNSILLSLDGSTRGKIYFWDHELQPQDQLESLDEYENLHPVADSFEQFILSLKREDEMNWDD